MFSQVCDTLPTEFFAELTSSKEKLRRPTSDIVKLDANENPYGPPRVNAFNDATFITHLSNLQRSFLHSKTSDFLISILTLSHGNLGGCW